jgi:hypothetical protein
MGKSLVVARVGAGSLHPSWRAADAATDWDLHLVPYQPVPFRSAPGLEVAEVVPGPKWSGVREYLKRWDGWRDYDFVWLPDDDIFTSQAIISRMFETARTMQLDLFAPALHDASYFAHYSTMRNRSFFGRWTGFVEIMMPALSVRALDELLPTLDLTETGWGWGLDSLWPKLLDYQNIAVLDGLPVLHTRPVGQMRDPELGKRVLAESDEIMSRNDCRQVHTSFGAFSEDGAAVDLDQESFFAQLVSGWQHLVDRDPRILTWLVQFQMGGFRWPDYPVAGTP